VISEPMTVATDLLLAAVCFLCARRLTASAGSRRAVRLLAGCLVAMGIGAVTGAAVHAWEPVMEPLLATVLWKVTLFSLGITSMLFVWMAATSALTGRARRIVVGLAGLQAALFVPWMVGHDDYLYVVLDNVPALGVVLGLQAVQWWRGERSARWIVGAIVVSAVGSGAQAAGLSPHEHFNHNDLYHVVQSAAVVLLTRGGLLLTDRAAPGTP
jgi:hypothetical protein